MITYTLERFEAETDPVERAREFATYAHGVIGQVRKYTGENYIAHPAGVVEILKTVPHTRAMLQAAWLHDTVEDTDTTIEDIKHYFGREVAQLVEMLTDVSRPDDGARAQRRAIDREHTANATPNGKTIKLADLIHNTDSIVEHDHEFAKVYLREKQLALQVLTEGDHDLWLRAHAQVTTAMHELGMVDD